MSEETTTHNRPLEAYERHLPEMKALPAEQVLVPNVDIASVTALVFGVLPNLAPFREAFRELKEVRVDAIDRVEGLFLALWQAESDFQAVYEPPSAVAGIAAEASLLREKLVAVVDALVAFDLAPRSAVPDRKGGKSYEYLAREVDALASLLRASRHHTDARTPPPLGMLDDAGPISERILAVVGQLEHTQAAAAETTQIRNRAFTLAFRDYDEIRRGVSYLRWNERDADTLVPRLPTTRHRGHGKSETSSLSPSVSSEKGVEPSKPRNDERTTEDAQRLAGKAAGDVFDGDVATLVPGTAFPPVDPTWEIADHPVLGGEPR
jgi:hypothetical protein